MATAPPRKVPSGTVTLLFTDVEGSTRLWEADPGAMAVALRRHDELVRAAIEDAGGYVFKTVGDSFCAAFEAPGQAVRSAAATQQAVFTASWETARPIRVRMGLHTGQAEERDNDYFGTVVNRTARLEAIAHGGQVLLSEATATLVRDSLASGTRLVDLGQHRLRDLGRPEHVYQLAVSGLPETFPQLASLDNPELPNNLPGLLSTFIGRDAELTRLAGLLGESRLVTLTGAGGCGKTRLALQAAAEQLDTTPDGVWFADLAPITDGAQIPVVVATALGLRDRDEHALLTALRDAAMLIVLDNCEHVIDAASAFSARVIRDCRTPKILATSREPLGIDGERVCRVASLSVPSMPSPTVADLEGSEAVRLFLDRARGVDPGFTLDDRTAPQVASLCRRLDGIPLALELAAARLSSMALPQLVERLDRRFRLLTGGSRNVMPRQQTLQATVDWSFSLLNDTEREALRRLAVFIGGFDLAAAEAICAADGVVDEFEVIDLLHSLVAKSLVVADHGADTVRYRLLETIRQYCAEDLLRAGGEEAALRLATVYADYFLAFAETAAPHTKGPDQGDWLRRLDQEWENLRAAGNDLTVNGRTEEVLRLCVALERFATSRGHVEVSGWLSDALDQAGAFAGAPATPLLVHALHCHVLLSVVLRVREVSRSGSLPRAADRELALARELADQKLETRALLDMCIGALLDKDTVAMRQYHDQALAMARRLGDRGLIAGILDLSFAVADSAEERRAACLESLRNSRAEGDLLMVALSEERLFSLDLYDGLPDLTQSRRHLEQAMSIAADIGAELFLYYMHSTLHMLLLHDGKYAESAALLRTDLLTIRRLGSDQMGGANVLIAAACCAAWQGDLEVAARLHGAADIDIEAAVADGSFFWSPLERELRDGDQDKLREAMGAEAFEAAYRAGTALGRTEAIDLALGRARSLQLARVRLVGRVRLPGRLEVVDAVPLAAPVRLHPHAHPHLVHVAAGDEMLERDVSPVKEHGRRDIRRGELLAGIRHVHDAERGDRACVRQFHLLGHRHPVGRAGPPGRDVDVAALRAALPEQLALGEPVQVGGFTR
jgi:predicted ATPase/class 3 adenylate cyclase